jgi:hypothetical protein
MPAADHDHIETLLKLHLPILIEKGAHSSVIVPLFQNHACLKTSDNYRVLGG